MIERTPSWKDSATASNYAPAPGGRMVVRLDAVTTGIIASVHRGKNHKQSAFVLVNYEGDVRRQREKVVHDWQQALQIALDEHLLIYSARSKKACRPIWVCEVKDRTMKNMTFEEVRLLPHEKTYFETLPAVNAKLFNIEP